MSTYNTIPFQVKNPLQEMERVARAMALPHEHPPQRLPSFPALERTAVIGFNQPLQLAVPAAGLRTVLFRQAAYPLWAELSTTGLIGIVLTYAQANDTPFGQYAKVGAPTNIYADNIAGAPGVAGLAGATAGLPGGPFQVPLGMDAACGSDPWFYVPSGWTLMVAAATTTAINGAGHTFAATFNRWRAPGEMTPSQLSMQLTCTGTTNCQAYAKGLANGWYQFSEFASITGFGSGLSWDFSVCVTNAPLASVSGVYSVTPLTMAYTIGGVPTPGGLWPVGNIPEWGTSDKPWADTRLTAAACLFTNVTKVMNKEGIVMCGRVSPQTYNVFQDTISGTLATLANLHPAEKQQLALETGAYTYCPPSTDLAFFTDYRWYFPSGGGPIGLFRLDNSALANILIFQDPDGGTTLSVNLDTHMEFRTSSALWQIGLSTMGLEQLHQAQLTLVAAGFFFSNENHQKDMSKIIGAIKSTAVKLLPTVASAVHPLAGKAVQAAMTLSRAPKSTPKPTSAAGSGLVRTPPKPQPKQKQKGKGKKK